MLEAAKFSLTSPAEEPLLAGYYLCITPIIRFDPLAIRLV